MIHTDNGNLHNLLGSEISAQAASQEPDISGDEATAALRERLIARLGGNLAEYFEIIHKLDTNDIAAWSFEIAAMTGAYHYLTEYHNFQTSELEYLLLYQNPLKIVADKFDAADMGDHSDIMWGIFHEQDALDGDYELMPDTSAEDALKQKLFDRLDKNLADYRENMMGASKTELFDLSADIASRFAAREYMKTGYDYKTGEVEFLMQYQDPLSLVAEHWPNTLDGLVDMSDVMADILEDRDSHGHFAKVMDASNPAAQEKGRGSAEKQSVIERIRAAEKAPKEPRKDKPARDKTEPEH